MRAACHHPQLGVGLPVLSLPRGTVGGHVQRRRAVVGEQCALRRELRRPAVLLGDDVVQPGGGVPRIMEKPFVQKLAGSSIRVKLKVAFALFKA